MPDSSLIRGLWLVDEQQPIPPIGWGIQANVPFRLWHLQTDEEIGIGERGDPLIYTAVYNDFQLLRENISSQK